MSVRTILVPVTGHDEGLACIEAAFKLGAHLGAHVEGLHARRDARDALAYIGEGMTGAMIYPSQSNHLHTGDALLVDARAVEADFLVMGAYTHSRLRRMIMGSATEHVLGAAALPVLMMP